MFGRIARRQEEEKSKDGLSEMMQACMGPTRARASSPPLLSTERDRRPRNNTNVSHAAQILHLRGGKVKGEEE